MQTLSSKFILKASQIVLNFQKPENVYSVLHTHTYIHKHVFKKSANDWSLS